MRTIDRTEPLGTLGRKIEPHKVATPDREVSPGVFCGKDGKLYTAITHNELANHWIPMYEGGLHDDALFAHLLVPQPVDLAGTDVRIIVDLADLKQYPIGSSAEVCGQEHAPMLVPEGIEVVVTLAPPDADGAMQFVNWRMKDGAWVKVGDSEA